MNLATGPREPVVVIIDILGGQDRVQLLGTSTPYRIEISATSWARALFVCWITRAG